MKSLSEALENTLNTLPEKTKSTSNTRQLGSTEDVGQIACLHRDTPLTEKRLMEIASQMLRQPFSITYEEKTIYGRKKITDEYGEYWADEQPLGKQEVIDCVIDLIPEKSALADTLKISAKEAYVKHLTHLLMHKKFGSTNQDRPVMLADYVKALENFPEFVVYQVCRFYWEHDRRPFVPFMGEMADACQIFTDAIKRLLNHDSGAPRIKKQAEEPWTPPTEEDKQKISNMLAEAMNVIGAE